MNPWQRRPYRKARLGLVLGCFALGFMAIAGRLYLTQIVQHESLRRLAARQYQQQLTLHPERGQIVDRQGRVLATSLPVPSVYAVPHEVANPDRVASQLAEVLQSPRARLHQQLQAQGPFVWLARQVTPEVEQRLRALALPGIHVLSERRRYYPYRHLAGQVLGFVGVDGQGLGGVEYAFDRHLSGQVRQVTVPRDALRRRLLAADPPRGADVHLTLDAQLQYLAEKELATRVEETGATRGLALLMQPYTGDILALALYPFFNPNDFRDPAQQQWQRNWAVTDPVEPGSTFKVIVAAAALEAEVARPEEPFFCEEGLLQRGPRRIRDHEPFGFLSFAEVLQFSSNIGAVKIAERLTPEQLYRYIRRFGFGESTGVGLPGESPGEVRPPKAWSGFSQASLALGQEIAVTPLQLITAYAAIANGGWLVQPRLVRSLVRGDTRQTLPPRLRRQVLSRRTAEQLTAILTGVTVRGTGRLAAVPGYAVAGKTGTAQKVDAETGGYSQQRVLASFVGYLPAEAPELVLLVMLDEPQRHRWGGQAAAPLFRRIAQQALHYLRVPPPQGKALTVRAPQPDVPYMTVADRGVARAAPRAE
ncbi:MAG: penicillin-binding protein [Candidatus Tectimicrobiota bacterium]|nr:MAG: penicillin-binding protein [Candidatus Tectomicrobia bacterium]